jgi:phosphoglycerate dehydrogenase-like enzyme
MPGSVIHVYHESADYLARLIARAAPAQEVVTLTSRDALAAALPHIEVLFAPVPPRDGWASARALRLVQILGVGVDTLLPSPDLPADVEVSVMRGTFAPEVAEHALALMLSHVRQLPELAELQRLHRFAASPRPTLAGQHLVIVGYGAVGQRLARAARALDMRVTAVSRSGRAPVGGADGVTVVSTDRLSGVLADAGYVVIAVPLTPATRGLFDAAMLGRLPRHAYVICVARGGIVDEDALAGAIGAGRLAGAALDVFAEEPLHATSPLWDVPKLAITPHVAGLGERYLERCVEALLANVTALAAGQPRTGLVDRHVGY